MSVLIVGLYLAARAHRKPAVRASLLGIACRLGRAARDSGRGQALGRGGSA